VNGASDQHRGYARDEEGRQFGRPGSRAGLLHLPDAHHGGADERGRHAIFRHRGVRSFAGQLLLPAVRLGPDRHRHRPRLPLLRRFRGLH
ncbi:unnamed protein product, partial [Ectocarpus sp. 13 AM-2016]